MIVVRLHAWNGPTSSIHRITSKPSSSFHSTQDKVMAKNVQKEVAEAIKELDFDANNYQLEINTSHGRILLDLLPDVAPGHCANMLALAKIGYYDGLIFHRVISGFMVQGGCPDGTGMGGPGYNIDAEFNDTVHNPGVLSMARSSDPNSAGSQFFLCLDQAPHLDGQYTAFGKTADQDSLDVVLKIGALPTDRSDRPDTEAKIESIKVIANAA